MTLSREFKALDAISSSRMWMTQTTSCYELRALDVMNKLKLWMI